MKQNVEVAIIGGGVTGCSIAYHLMKAGFAATIYSRTKEKAQSLLDQGASWAATPKDVAEKSDVIFAIVGFPKDVREVFLGQNGALAGSKAGNVSRRFQPDEGRKRFSSTWCG